MAGPIRIHLRVPGTAPIPELMKLLRDVEAAGFDGVGILDSQMLCRDTFVTLGQAATQTSRLTLFPAVTNPFTRHASVLAGAIATVEELAPGRVKFVIGTGYTSASTIGRKPATLAEMRACISQVKALLAGGYDGLVRARAAVKDEVKPIDDLRSSREYRREMAAVLLERAVRRVAEA